MGIYVGGTCIIAMHHQSIWSWLICTVIHHNTVAITPNEINSCIDVVVQSSEIPQTIYFISSLFPPMANHTARPLRCPKAKGNYGNPLGFITRLNLTPTLVAFLDTMQHRPTKAYEKGGGSSSILCNRVRGFPSVKFA